MLGFIIGCACGAVEFFLLTQLIKKSAQKSWGIMALLLILKLAVFICAFVPLILYRRSDLLWCGIGISAVLVLSPVIWFAIKQFCKGGNKD